MKVYCKNCKYLDCIQMCEFISNPEIDPIGFKYHSGWREPLTVNKNYDCKDYKRKFWKFWVKD